MLVSGWKLESLALDVDNIWYNFFSKNNGYDYILSSYLMKLSLQNWLDKSFFSQIIYEALFNLNPTSAFSSSFYAFCPLYLTMTDWCPTDTLSSVQLNLIISLSIYICITFGPTAQKASNISTTPNPFDYTIDTYLVLLDQFLLSKSFRFDMFSTGRTHAGFFFFFGGGVVMKLCVYIQSMSVKFWNIFVNARPGSK